MGSDPPSFRFLKTPTTGRQLVNTDYDVLVLGAGPAGENAADIARRSGLRVGIIEPELVGGECSYWACMPSKGLLRPGEALTAARRVPGAAEAVTGELDVEAALERRNRLAANWDDAGQVDWLKSVDVDLIRGRGRLAGVRRVDVEHADESVSEFEVEKAVVIATGTSAQIPPVEGLSAIRIWDNREATSAKEVPQRLLVLGGGVVGVEMAQAWKSLGAEEVTIVEMQDHLLPREEPFAGRQLQEALEDLGVSVHVNARMVRASRDGNDGPVTGTMADGSSVTADEILVAVGRRANTRDIGLETVGLEPGRFIDVDDRMIATEVDGDWLLAVGDVNGRALLTHTGKYQARVAGAVLAGRDTRARSDVSATPRVIFTDPQVAAVGMTEHEAVMADIEVRAVEYPTGRTAGASTTGRGIKGTSKLVVDADRHVIVGATFVGPGVAELLHAATIAIVAEVPLQTLWHAIPSFPTMSEIWLRFLEKYRDDYGVDLD